ncbi:MAG: hypothetical protein VKJ06_07520 [Vampirovibrionales bacterium]|nr:hypothetical protein [Vampirovibrionales bacterium]
MSYKNDSEIVILNNYGKMSGNAKAEMFETYDRLRDLTVSGPTMGGSGLGKFASFLMNMSKMFGGPSITPTLGSQAITIPGTSYVAPVGGGTGIVPGGQAAFGLAPFSQVAGITGGAAGLSLLLARGIGNQTGFDAPNVGGFDGIGSIAGGAASLTGSSGVPFESGFDLGENGLAGGVIAGGAAGIGTAGSTAANLGGSAAGLAAGAGYGRNWVLPAAGVVSGIGGLMTTLAPFFGPFGLAGAAAGSVMNGAAGAVINSFQHAANRVLVNADTILSNKVKNLETVVKMMDAQQDVLKKMVKESYDGQKKALENI